MRCECRTIFVAAMVHLIAVAFASAQATNIQPGGSSDTTVDDASRFDEQNGDQFNAIPLTVEDTVWGLGSVTAMTFNQVAVQIRNDSSDAFDGTLWLAPEDPAFNSRQSATSVVRETYLSPGETRWVPFGVFMVDGATEWSITWKTADEEVQGSTKLPPVTFKSAAVVAVTGSTRSFRMATFPAARFPTKATLLDGAHAFVFAEVPDWQPGQEAALAGWLAAGGRVIIGQDAVGQDVVGWAGTLSRLNNPSRRSRFGAGSVLRVAGDVSDMTEQQIRDLLTIRATDDQVVDTSGRTPNRLRSGYAWDLDGEVFLSLDRYATPRTLAYLFYPLVLTYLVLLAGLTVRNLRERWSTRRYLVTLAIVVSGTTLVLAFVSPLSAGGASRCVSITYAIDLGDTVTGSTNMLDLRHFTVYRTSLSKTLVLGDDKANTSANGVSVESELVNIGSSSVSATTIDGRKQQTRATLPGVTNVFIRSRQQVAAEPPRWSIEFNGIAYELKPANDLAKDFKPMAALLQRGKSVGRFDRELKLESTKRPLKDFLVNPSMAHSFHLDPVHRRRNSGLDYIFDAAGKALPAFHRATGVLQPKDVELEAGFVRLFVLTEAPPEYQPHSDALRADNAYIVWCSQFEDIRPE